MPADKSQARGKQVGRAARKKKTKKKKRKNQFCISAAGPAISARRPSNCRLAAGVQASPRVLHIFHRPLHAMKDSHRHLKEFSSNARWLLDTFHTNRRFPAPPTPLPEPPSAENSSEVVAMDGRTAPAVNRRWQPGSDAAGLAISRKRIFFFLFFFFRTSGLILIGGLIKVATVNSPPGAAGPNWVSD